MEGGGGRRAPVGYPGEGEREVWYVQSTYSTVYTSPREGEEGGVRAGN